MENLTLGDIANVLAFIAGVLASGGSISLFLSKRIRKMMDEALKPTNSKIDSLALKVEQVDTDNCKNYLQQTISTLDAGEKLDSVAVQRFYENYDHYTQDLKLNSWVHREVVRLEQEGKLKR